MNNQKPSSRANSASVFAYKAMRYARHTVGGGIVAFTCLLSTYACAQAIQGSDIWIAKLNIESKHAISDLIQVTNTNSYSNQPYFFDSNRLYYTQMHGEGDEVQTDIHLFDLALGTDTNITQTPESEYSATPLPKKRGMSVIRVNKEGKQELWELDFTGKPVKHLAPNIEPVGYQVWIDENNLLLFVLGEPHTLQQVNISESQALSVTVDSHIGASLYRFKNTSWYLYAKNYDAIQPKETETASKKTVIAEINKGNWIYAFNSETGKARRVTSLPDTSEYFAITPSGFLITSDGKQVLSQQIVIKEEKLGAIEKWRPLKIKQKQCSTGVSRIGVSGDGTMIALVCSRKE